MAEKICAVCGDDCSSKPRTKDPQGQYYCRECYEQAIQRKRERKSRSSASPPAPDSAADMGLLEEVLTSARAGIGCPQCSAALPDGSVLCTSCGYNLQSGGQLQVETQTASKESPFSALSLDEIFTPARVGLAALAGHAIFAMWIFAFGGGEIAISLFSLWHLPIGLAAFVLIIVSAFRESIVQLLLVLCIPFYVLYFVFAVTDNLWARWMFLASLMGQILLIFITINNPELEMSRY